jgi:transcriptional regulator with XRE-family HTH domain
METGTGLGDFLRAKRELLTPEDVGLPATGRRRVQGLRREEAALLAGISPEQYLRLEQGLDEDPSDEVLENVGRALKLDEAALGQLKSLARPVPPRRSDAGPVGPDGSPSQRLTDLINAWPNQAAYLQGRLFDVLAANPLAVRLSPAFAPGTNVLRATFLEPSARELSLDWPGMQSRAVAALRALIGPNIDDPALAQLVGELSVRSAEFRTLWATQDSAADSVDTLRLKHPQVGELELRIERFDIGGSDGQLLVIMHAEPGSASDTALRRLAAIVNGTSSAEAQRSLPAPVPIESRRRLP